MKINITLIFFLASLLIALPAQAAYGERWYNVEVIIFANNNDAALQEEHWPQDPGVPDSSHSVNLVSSAGLERLPGQIIEFEKLPIKMLSAALSRLKRSSRYRVIYANAWRLPDLPKHKAPPVRIKAGRRFIESGEPAAAVNKPFSHTQGVISQVLEKSEQPERLDDVLYEIDGRIKISLSKYLDVDADLLYRSHVMLPDYEGIPVNEFRAFRLTEFRRMKSKTIHYLDHPMFSVVIGIDRYNSIAEMLPSTGER